jgi:cell wall-associated NlpC family hydrolase
VLSIAASLAGIYYIYGGTTTAGFDCSGFTQYVFRKVGIHLPRTAEQQRQAVRAVSSPRPGDLVFAGSPAYHVGIYAGNHQMWDSPRTGKTSGKHTIWASSVTYGRP